MNKTVELVNLWGDFEKGHPDAGIMDFCRYMLVKEREANEDTAFLGGAVPLDPYSRFAKLIGRITRVHTVLSLPLLKSQGISSFEDFAFLNTVYKMRQPRKTDVIQTNFVELSSGLLIIERLKKSGWISEKNDADDRRSKRLSILPEGEKLLEEIYGQMAELNRQCFEGIPADDLLLCMQLMAPLEPALLASWLKSRGK